jgi:ribulose-phosphate 3-epimerase
MNKIIPTIFAHNKKEFDERYKKLIKITKNIQIDFMDGKFVRAKSVELKDIPKLPRNYNFEAHLMCKNPEKYIKLLKEKGFEKVIFHFNSGDNVKTIALIKESGMKAFLAVNPEDKVKDFCYLLGLLDGILVMGVHPGKEHQKFIPQTIKKVKEIRGINDKIPIQVDGGVNLKTIGRLKKAGANIFNSGSFVSEAENPKKALIELRKE